LKSIADRGIIRITTNVTFIGQTGRSCSFKISGMC